MKKKHIFLFILCGLIISIAFPVISYADASTQHLSSKTSTSKLACEYPLKNNHSIINEYTPPSERWLAGHRGVDIEASSSTEAVYASCSGRVVYAGKLVDRYVISLEHTGNIRTTYEPVEPVVHIGDHVEKGQLIGYINGNHCGDISCIHWGAKTARYDYINPMSLINGKHIHLIE